MLQVSHFWPPSFGLITVRSLIYTPISLIFTTKYFFRIPPKVVSIHGHEAHAPCENDEEREASHR